MNVTSKLAQHGGIIHENAKADFMEPKDCVAKRYLLSLFKIIEHFEFFIH